MDVISDMLIRIKNAQAVRKQQTEIPYSKLKMNIAKILQTQGYIKEAVRRGKKIKKIIDITLLYDDHGHPRITGVRRVSKLSKRVYVPASLLRSIRHGKGIAVVSTSKGILTNREAIRQHVGGEVLFEIW